MSKRLREGIESVDDALKPADASSLNLAFTPQDPNEADEAQSTKAAQQLQQTLSAGASLDLPALPDHFATMIRNQSLEDSTRDSDLVNSLMFAHPDPPNSRKQASTPLPSTPDLTSQYLGSQNPVPANQPRFRSTGLTPQDAPASTSPSPLTDTEKSAISERLKYNIKRCANNFADLSLNKAGWDHDLALAIYHMNLGKYLLRTYEQQRRQGQETARGDRTSDTGKDEGQEERVPGGEGAKEVEQQDRLVSTSAGDDGGQRAVVSALDSSQIDKRGESAPRESESDEVSLDDMESLFG